MNYENFEKYDYEGAVTDDIVEYLEGNEKTFINASVEQIYDDLWTTDYVTGNGSGSYTFSSFKAQVNLAGNWDLLEEALEEFGGIESAIEKGAEYCDVTIRCYLLSQCLRDALKILNWKSQIDEMNGG